jgi:hypothetical protein
VVSVGALAKKSKGCRRSSAGLERRLDHPHATAERDGRRVADVRVAVLTRRDRNSRTMKLGPKQQQALDLLRGAPDGIP